MAAHYLAGRVFGLIKRQTLQVQGTRSPEVIAEAMYSAILLLRRAAGEWTVPSWRCIHSARGTLELIIIIILLHELAYAHIRLTPPKGHHAKLTTMTLKETLRQLKALGNERMRKQNTKNGAGDNQFGVRLGELKKLAKKIKTNHELAMALWGTGNIDARLLATLLIKPKSLSVDEMDRMVRSVTFVQVADWLNAYVVKLHPEKETLRQGWMVTDNPMAARAGWSLTTGRIVRSPAGLDLPGLLKRIESEMGSAAPEVQWTMNCALAEIGIHFPEHRARALGVGETLGIYRDYPVSRGCTSPFAPTWINEMVSRQS